MSAMPNTPLTMTEAEYLAYEFESDIKHEYMSGEVWAMTGASLRHNTIAVNLLTTLKNTLRGKNCNVYPSDMRVQVADTKDYMYPDVSVVCGDVQLAENVFDSLINPTVIIEVLSPSTERYDRGKKFQLYRRTPTLNTYLLIAQDSPRVERYTKADDATWTLTDIIGLDAVVALLTLDCELALNDIYDGMAFTS
ncbi:MAG: Uma2 family endonuclease [Chloroflexota bacterium]